MSDLSQLAQQAPQGDTPPPQSEPPQYTPTPLPQINIKPQQPLGPIAPAPQAPPTPQAPKTSQAAPAAQQRLPRTDPYQPYIPTRGGSPSEWGKPDFVMQGAQNYPGGGLPPGPYMPQPHDMAALVPAIAMGLGRFGSRHTGMSALAMGSFAASFVQAMQEGRKEKAAEAERQYMLALRQTAERQKQESLEYGETWALYGPNPETGAPGNEDRMRQAIWDIANKYGDDRMRNVLAQEGLGQAEKLLQYRDGHGKDAEKLLSQTEKRLQIQRQQQEIELGELRKQEALDKIAATKGKADAARHKWDDYVASPSGAAPVTPSGAAPAPGPVASGADTGVPDDAPSDPGINWDWQKLAPGRSGPKATPEEPEQPPVAAPQAQAGTPSEAPEQTAAAEPEQQPGPSPQQPIRVAEADTGTMSDAPPPEATAMRVAQADTTPPAPTAPSSAAAPRTNLGSRRQAAAGPTQLPGVRVEAPALSDDFSSDYLKQDLRDPQGRPVDKRKLEQLAETMSMGLLHVEDQKKYPDGFLGMAAARALEIQRDMDRLARDPPRAGETQQQRAARVYASLDQLNPSFGAAMRGWINGDFSPPKEAWRNQEYVQRIIGIGQQIDPTFNEQNAKIRLKTKQGFANGEQARTMTAAATLDRHASLFLKDLQELQSYSPWVIQQYLAGGAYAQTLGIPKKFSELVGRLGVDTETVANEYERVLNPGKVAVSTRNDELKKLDWRSGITTGNINSVMAAAKRMQEYSHERMGVLLHNYETIVGKDKDSLWQLYNGYANSGADKGEADPLGPTSQAVDARAHVREMLMGDQPNSLAPHVGHVEDGYRFKGGDPTNPNSWEPAH